MCNIILIINTVIIKCVLLCAFHMKKVIENMKRKLFYLDSVRTAQ
jgi:hypothetical protein